MKKGEDQILFRLTVCRHPDDRIEVQLKRRRLMVARRVFNYPKPEMSRAELSDAFIRFIQDVNEALARAQRLELSRGPTQEMSDGPEDG